MKNKVWNIIQKDIWTEEGQIKIEQLHDAIVRIFDKADKNDMRILCDGMCTSLFPTMDILEEYLKEKDNLIADVKITNIRKNCEESDFCPVKCNEYPELCPTGYALYVNKMNNLNIK